MEKLRFSDTVQNVHTPLATYKFLEKNVTVTVFVVKIFLQYHLNLQIPVM